MRKTGLLLLLALMVGCSDNKVSIPDNQGQIDANKAEIELVKAHNALQDLRLDDLEVRVSDLEGRMDLAEAGIDANEVKIAELCSRLTDLEGDVADLRDDFTDAVRRLERADRRTRRMLRHEVRSLRLALLREIRARHIADYRLQRDIDDVERDLNRFEARQSVINFFLARGLFMTNQRISQLQARIANALSTINSRLDTIESDIATINSEIATLQTQMSTMQAQLTDVESRLVSVIYPCGSGNSEEVLLQTQDGLVAYFQEMRWQTLTFSDTVTIDAYSIPAHTDKYCKDTSFFSGNCNDYGYRHVGAHTIPAQTYNVGDSASVKVLKKAYLDVLGQGTYGTTDGYSCTFSIDANGELVGGL